MNQLPNVLSYDLTTQEGMKLAIVETSTLKEMLMENPTIAIGVSAYKFGSALFDRAADDRKKVIDGQRKAAIDIIKAGKANVASKIRVTLNQKAGVDIDGSLEGFSLKFLVGTDYTK